RGTGYALWARDEELGEFATVVLAIGGAVSGGVALAELGGKRAAAFRFSLEVPLAVELDGELAEASSLAALDFVARGLGALERVGVAADAFGAASGAAGLFVAGDALAGRPRGVLSAARSGQLAAQGALAHLSRLAP